MRSDGNWWRGWLRWRLAFCVARRNESMLTVKDNEPLYLPALGRTHAT
jgi:hypothetical protein